MQEWKLQLIQGAEKAGFPIHRPIFELKAEEYDMLWDGSKHFKGLNEFFEYLESKSYKIQFRVMLSRYRGKTRCTTCKGSRLRKEASYVKVGGFALTDLINWPIDKLQSHFENAEAAALWHMEG